MWVGGVLSCPVCSSHPLFPPLGVQSFPGGRTAPQPPAQSFAQHLGFVSNVGLSQKLSIIICDGKCWQTGLENPSCYTNVWSWAQPPSLQLFQHLHCASFVTAGLQDSWNNHKQKIKQQQQQTGKKTKGKKIRRLQQSISSWEVVALGRLLEEPMPTLLHVFPGPPSAPQAAEHVPQEGFFPSFSLGKLQRRTCRVILVLLLISFWRTLSPLRFLLENYLFHNVAWSSEKKWHCCEQRKAKQRTPVAKQSAILKWDPDSFLLHTQSDLQW